VRVHVGRHNLETIREAARTLGSADIEYALDCLESQANLREPAWGPAELFVEVTLLPQANERHTQCDLILCFRDRAAVIDIKRKELKGVELQRTRNQIAGQRKAIGRRAYAAGWDEQCAVPMVFVPEASAQDIAELRMALDADQDRHFVVAGNLRDATFLPTVCMTLSANVRETPTPRKFSVEGETGNEDVHDHGGGAVGAGDRGGGEGGAPAVHGR